MDDVEAVKQKVDISELLGEYITLKRAGKNFKALCPFHGEKTPSFVISPERQIWHCFGCQKGGDVFSFLMEYEKMDFYEALKTLAQRANVKLSGSLYRNEDEKKRDQIFSINSLAMQFYHFLLTRHKTGEVARAYLHKERVVPEALVEKFSIGFAPFASSSLSAYLTQKKGFAKQTLIEAGLATQDRGGLRDFFRGRIIFPIHDARGNIVAFSGRAMGANSMPKYINTRETLVYKKGETAYGLYFAKDEIKKEGKVIIVEGEFDVISSFKEGIKNVVALKGTALTEPQIKLLKRYADKFLFCFDTDIAGNNAAARSIEMIEKEGVMAGVIIPPEGKDPDELLRENPALFKKAVKNEKNIYEYLIESVSSRENISSAEGKRSIVEKVLPFLSLIENEVVKEHYLKKLSQTIDSSLESLVKQLNKIKFKEVGKSLLTSAPKKAKTREEMVESYLLSLLLQANNLSSMVNAAKLHLDGTTLTTDIFQKIFQKLQESTSANSNITLQDFSKLLPPELHQAFDKCCLLPIPEFESDEQYIKEVENVARQAKSLSLKKQIKEISEAIQKLEKESLEGNEEKLLKLRNEFGLLSQKIK